MYKNRSLLIVTKHGKDKVIAPILDEWLGVKSYTANDINTDIFGTFSGEILRASDPITTVREKCIYGMNLLGADLAVASEGSFGPHPFIPFISADEEFLIFIDKQQQVEIVVRELSTSTNFLIQKIKSISELEEFLDRVNFPSHGIFINVTDKFNNIKRYAINSNEELNQVSIEDFFTENNVEVETDMRAMNNPTRMNVIEQATLKLVNRINAKCKNCNKPGFGITDYEEGLPCEYCGFPTKSIINVIYSCNYCMYKEVKLNPKGKLKENPMYCNFCNP